MYTTDKKVPQTLRFIENHATLTCDSEFGRGTQTEPTHIAHGRSTHSEVLKDILYYLFVIV
jgi:hypothetical protein